MKLFGKEFFGKKEVAEASPSNTPSPQSASPKSESGAGWYTATDTDRRLKQVVIDLPNSKAIPSEFGILMLPAKRLSLLSSSWVSGFSRMEGKPAPYLLIRADDDIDEFKTNPTKIAFSFFKMRSGGIFAIYVYVDSQALRTKRSQRHVYIDAGNGLDVPEYVQLVQDAFTSDLLTVVLAGGSGSTAEIVNASGQSQDFKLPRCHYDIHLSLERSCREVLRRELQELISFHASLPSGQRSYKQSMNEVWQLMPETESPVLQRRT